MTARRVRVRFEKDWRFFKGKARNAHEREFNDSKWRRLDLPHDFSIEGRFDPKDPGGQDGGYLPAGFGWYRKTFVLPEEYRGRRVIVEFDGVYMNASVWINGHNLGIHHYGYTSFHFDLTPWLRFGNEKNVLAVSVDNTKRPNTRWYSGSGIYRHVWLTVTDMIHIAHWGVAVSSPAVSKAKATVQIETRVENETGSAVEATLATSVSGPGGKAAACVESTKRIGANSSCKFVQRLVVKKPALWNVDSPSLHRAACVVKAGGQVKDDCAVNFGIRSFRFDPDRGFILNGKHLKLKGVNMHHDNGCLGSAVYDRAEERRVELVKAIGANAIRTSHNPPSPEFLDSCDRLGAVVIDEAFDEWEVGKLKYGYKDFFKKCWRDDIAAMVLRDRNHPSVVLWSIGNEVPEQGKARGARTARKLARRVRKLDPTRPVGYGAFPGKWTRQLWEALDVRGYNYRDDLYEPDRKAPPKQCILGTETFARFAFESWTRATENRHVGGEFIWTGMDYIGESGIGHASDAFSRYPVNTACCGELDICGFKKTRSYYRDILWDNGTLLHIAVRRPLDLGEPFRLSPWGWPEAKSSWTWPQADRKHFARYGLPLQVDVYSACDEVELRLNGRTIGRNRTSSASRHMATWIVPFERGVLEAIGYKRGKRAAAQVLRTAGEPAKIRLTPDRKRIFGDGSDLSFVTVEALDKTGTPHPNADNEVVFSIAGPGEIAGVASGNQASEEPFKAEKRRLYDGRCLVVIKSAGRAGRILLSARAEGLAPARAVISAR